MIHEPFNDDWYVEKVDSGRSGERTGPISVPHDAMMFEQRDPHLVGGHSTGYFPGGVYRYTKTIRPPEDWRDKEIVLEFEGVFHGSEVRLDGVVVGGRPSGYALFHVPLTSHLRIGEEHVLEVLARNDDQPNSRWYTGSGIYRPVNLLVGDRVHVVPQGLRVSTISVSDGRALVDVATEVSNSGPSRTRVALHARIEDERGAALAAASCEAVLDPGDARVVSQTLEIEGAELWSPDSPTLHRAVAEVRDTDSVLDRAQAAFGIRTVSVDARNGLRINGVKTKLRGAAIHHDNGVIGAHTLEAAEERRVRTLKESGYNAIRSAHNPISTALLRACDRHGILVMDELADAWWRPMITHDHGGDFFGWWERNLASMIAKDFNHPSVILYSLGNEIPETGSPRGVELSRRMVALVRALDPTRFTTNAVNGFVTLLAPQNDDKIAAQAAKKAAKKKGADDEGKAILVANLLVGAIEKAMHLVARLPAVDKKTRDIFATVDIAGYNYMHGRYAMDGRAYPDRVILGTETQPSSTAEIWREIEDLPHVIGDFAWTGWDYIGEAGIASPRYDDRRRLVLPYPGLLAGEPIVDITGHRQTQSYVNEIIWHRSRGPHLAVRPVSRARQKRVKSGWRVSDSIRSWSWPGCEGTTATVEIYADAHRVELLLDGRRVGEHRLIVDDDWCATFTIPYRPGLLEAVAYSADGSELGRDRLVTAAEDVLLRVVPEVEQLRGDGADLAYVPIELTDKDGTVHSLADRDVTVRVTGAGTLLGFGSAEPTTEQGFASERHSTYYGRALAVVRAGLESGDVTVAVSAEGCDEVSVTLPVVSVDRSTAECPGC